MVEYKWVALSNTTIGTLMAAIGGTIVLISLPAIFRGIAIDPLTSFQYLLWILFGYSLVTSMLLVSFGRISDMYGRVRLFNLGFAIFTIGSLLCAALSVAGAVASLLRRSVYIHEEQLVGPPTLSEGGQSAAH
ncbi:MAG TPA: hypothetical protein VKF39_03975 [Nitrososphaerales archaeon]|nr:hypothetical protein [Nitrososphaerales archaeon]